MVIPWVSLLTMHLHCHYDAFTILLMKGSFQAQFEVQLLIIITNNGCCCVLLVLLPFNLWGVVSNFVQNYFVSQRGEFVVTGVYCLHIVSFSVNVMHLNRLPQL